MAAEFPRTDFGSYIEMLYPLLQLDAAQVAVADSVIKAAAQTREAVAESFKRDPEGALHQLGQDAVSFGLKLLAAVAIYFIGAWLIRRIKRILVRSMERKATDKAIVTFTSSLVTIILTALLIVMVIGTLGINTTSIAALLAAGGMALGMALSGTVQNFAGGIMLIIFKPFKAGEYIQAQGYEGTVSEVNIVSTKLTTPDNKVIVLPNGALSSGTINNYSRKEVRRQDFSFPLAHDVDIDRVIGILQAEVSKDSRVISVPTGEASAPSYLVTDINKDGVCLSVRIWCKTEDYWSLYYDFRKSLYQALRQADVDFAASRLEIGSAFTDNSISS